MSKTIEKSKQVPLVRDSAHQIWLAGLGALSLAEDESGKLFHALVKRGAKFEVTNKVRFDDLREKLDVQKLADSAIAKVSDTFDDGVTEVIHRLGLPTKKEIEGLTKRVERLTKTLETTPKAPRRHAKRRTHVAQTATL